MTPVMLAVVAGGAMLAVLVIVGVIWARSLRRADAGRALIVHSMRGQPRVVFEGAAVILPIVHMASFVDITSKQVVITRRGKDGVHFSDGIRADVVVTFSVRVNRTADDVLEVAQSIGAERAANMTTLEELFTAKFSEAIKIVFGSVPFEASLSDRERIRDQLIHVIGKDLNGFVLDDASIDFLEQTPVASLDPNNILDAKGIKKIEAMAVEDRTRAKLGVPTPPRWSTELERNGLRDVRVTVEIECDVAQRSELRSALASSEVRAALGGRLPESVLIAAGDGELSCADGKATLRWTETDVTADQIVAGAKIVLALRTDPAGYR